MDKPRLVPISFREFQEFQARAGELNVPVGHVPKGGGYYADSTELRLWRSTQADTGEKQT